MGWHQNQTGVIFNCFYSIRVKLSSDDAGAGQCVFGYSGLHGYIFKRSAVHYRKSL